MTDDLDAICAEYLAALDAALVGVPIGERRQIVEQISEHITTARAALPQQTKAAVREILERLGPPKDIAAAASSETVPAARRGRWPILLASGVAVAVVCLGIGLAAAVGAFSSTSAPSSTNIFLQPPGAPTTEPVTGSPAKVTVPTVTDEQLSRAITSLTAVGLAYRVAQTTGATPIGTVIKQLPAGGSTATAGTSVELTVVGMAPAVTVPNVVGQFQAQAAATLAEHGLAIAVVGPVPNDRVATGIVISQSPAAGATMPPKAEVTVTVSAGPTAGSAQQHSTSVP